jgi:PqqD family protein of HPr-rel-A system
MTDQLGTQLLPKRRDLPARFAVRELLVRDPANGKVHFLNRTAAAVWECCDGSTSITECESRLREQFAVPIEADVLGDIQQSLADFARRGLLDV